MNMVEIGQAYFLHELTPRELHKVQALAQTRRFTAGEAILTVGGEVSRLYVVGSGTVRVVVPVERRVEAEEDLLGRMGPGECFGEFSFADRRPASASVIADPECTVHELPFEDLDTLMASDPELARKLLRAMFRTVVARLRSTDADLVMARYVLRYV